MFKTRSIEWKKATLKLLIFLSSIIHTGTAHEKVHDHARVKRQATTPPPPWDPNLVLGAVSELRDVNLGNNTDALSWIPSRTPTDSSTVSVNDNSQFTNGKIAQFILSMLPSNLANRRKVSPLSQMTARTPSTLTKTQTKAPTVLEFDPLVQRLGDTGETFSSDPGKKKKATSDVVTNNPHGSRHESIILNENEQDSLNMGFTVPVNPHGSEVLPDWLTDESAIFGVVDLGMDMDTPIIDFTSSTDLTGTDDITSAVDTLHTDDITNTANVIGTVTNAVDLHIPNADVKSVIITTTTLKPLIPPKCNEKCLIKQRANALRRIQQLNLNVKNLLCLRNGQKQGCWKNQTVKKNENSNKKSSQTQINERKQNSFDKRIKTTENQILSLQTKLDLINNKIEEFKNAKANSVEPARKQRHKKVATKQKSKRG